MVTAGAGFSLPRSSSFDFVYHAYRLVEPPPCAMPGSRPSSRASTAFLGEQIDLVLAVEAWERFELDLIGSAFRAGRAFGATPD